MGTPDFAVPCLKALVESGENVTAVFSQPDKPKGRGYKLTPPPVKEYAVSQNIPVYQPASLKKGDKIVTIGGIYGTVSSVKENSVVVKVDDNAKIEFTKSAISKVINETTEKAAETKEAKASKKDKNEDSESSKEEK